MPISRRQLVLGALAAGTVLPTIGHAAGEHPLDKVAVWLVPLDDFPEEMAATLARILQADLKIKLRASGRLPPLDIPTLPGTDQAISEELLRLALPASKMATGSDSYRVFLTMRDINARSGNFRFQFATHAPRQACSVVSLARLLEYKDGEPRMSERSALRLHKMVKRAIAELHRAGAARPIRRT
ncbi:hypothetical protein [Massilia sp. Se16.2.3]|uniref:hypothetical protein n=1 Tax=Massilia sp. Se16.2.3 TaxID=2709303 RepID=UPI001600E999|nr:hypothetical protein [Massilia sp. Se16.2.3]QNA98925.1 hypothetical protein G4G31_08880 [Massilia sp. Se16.2.3]